MAAILASSAVLRRAAVAAALAAAVAAVLLVFFSAPLTYPADISSFGISNFVSNSNFVSDSDDVSFIFATLSPAPSPSLLYLNSADATNSTDLVNSAVASTLESMNSTAISPPPSIAVSDLKALVSTNSTVVTAQPAIADTKVPDVPPVKRKKHLWLMTPQEQLVYAKNEINQAPWVWNDPELHAPLFHNLSVFKRSYEMMERILKVYIYQEGQRPIFHTPILSGIYASEGWFMKQMEENGKFVTKDPNVAHLFYLAYSAVKLEEALYVANSHALRPLAIFLRNYVNMLASKYPFWNRTRGADHFMVACHDWGPYETREHAEFRQYTIKVVCNADLNEGFVRGKDVSLPETNVRTPKWPIKDIGGKPISKRTIFAFYAGQDHGRVRPILRKHWEGKDNDMKIFGVLPRPRRVSKRTMTYAKYMKSSKYCICPMGYEVNSPRIVEAIHYECVPVIIADDFVLPFEEVLNWSAFSVVVAEKDIPNLKGILLRIPKRRYITMQKYVKRLQKHFLWNSHPAKYDLFHMILHSIWFNRLNQIQV